MKQSPQQVIIKQQSTPTVQKVSQGNVVVSAGGQVLQQQVVISGSPVVTTQGGQQVKGTIYSSKFCLYMIDCFQIITNQIVVNNQTLAQQLASGKVQVATINGQQVLIRPTGNNQAQVVAQLTPGSITTQAIQPQAQQVNVAASPSVGRQIVRQQQVPDSTVAQQPQQVQPQSQPQAQQQPMLQQALQSPNKTAVDNQIDQATMEQLLVGMFGIIIFLILCLNLYISLQVNHQAL